MPHVIVKLWKGKSEEQKKELADKIAKDIMETLGSSKGSISVAVEDYEKKEWAEKVYIPDIQNKEETILIKPGYSLKDLGV